MKKRFGCTQCDATIILDYNIDGEFHNGCSSLDGRWFCSADLAPVTFKAAFEQALKSLESQHQLRANYPTEEGETWSFAEIERIKGRLDSLIALNPECPLDADEISNLYYWITELLELSDLTSSDEIKRYKAQEAVLEEFVSKLSDR